MLNGTSAPGGQIRYRYSPTHSGIPSQTLKQIAIKAARRQVPDWAVIDITARRSSCCFLLALVQLSRSRCTLICWSATFSVPPFTVTEPSSFRVSRYAFSKRRNAR